METWYHGSNQVLTVLRAGSTITLDRRLAEVFSHRPTRVSRNDEGTIRHNGAQAGWVHVVDEAVTAEDAYPHPQTVFGPGDEWITRRDLCLRLIGPVTIASEELLSEAEVLALTAKARQAK
jgi:hypothetical protein